MSTERSEPPVWNGLLSQAARLLRQARMMRVADVARAMGMRPRTYQLFEAGGGGHLSLERIDRLSAILDADPHAVWAAIMIGSPPFALRAADNKLMTAFLIGLREFDEAAGDDIRLIDAVTSIGVFEDAFARLLDEARRKAAINARTAGNK